MSALLRRRIATGLGTLCLAAGCVRPSGAAVSAPFQILANKKNPIVWQRIGDGLLTTEDITGGRICYWYDYIRRIIVTLQSVPRPGTWTPLGSEIKWLMFVGRYNNLDKLMAHCVDDEDTGFVVIRNNPYNQLPCGMSGMKCIFGEYRPQKVGDHYPVDLYSNDVQTGSTVLFFASDSEKTQFAHDGVTMVYRWYNGPEQVGIYGIRFSGGDEFEIAARDGFEPSVCGSLVAWAETSGPGYNIMAKDMSTGEMRTVAYTTANPPRPEAGQGSVFWEDARNQATTGLDVYGYDWATAQEFPVTTASGDQTKLRVCGDLVTWCTTGYNTETVWGATILQPPRIGDLRPTLVTADSVQLAWTSVGTAQNPPVQYDLRYRTDGPITDANWDASTVVPGLPTPGSPGQAESFTVSQLAAGHYYFAIKARLNDGTYSTLSNCPCAYVSTQPDGVRSANEGAYISFSGVVTGADSTTGSFYCQWNPSVALGAIKVILKSGEAVPSVNQYVTATGMLGQHSLYFGPVLTQASKTSSGTGAAKCYAMGTVSLGGQDPRYGGTLEERVPNLWMKVKSWGTVTNLNTTNGCMFYFSDGTYIPDHSGLGVFVTSPYAAPVGIREGSYVSVEGICRVSRYTGRQIEVVQPDKIRVWLQ